MRTLVLGFLSLLLAGTCLAADKKISELTSGSPLQQTDMIPIARGAANFRLAGSDFVPKEVDCSSFYNFNKPCDFTPIYASVQRSVVAKEWSSGYFPYSFASKLINIQAPASATSWPSFTGDVLLINVEDMTPSSGYINSKGIGVAISTSAIHNQEVMAAKFYSGRYGATGTSTSDYFASYSGAANYGQGDAGTHYASSNWAGDSNIGTAATFAGLYAVHSRLTLKSNSIVTGSAAAVMAVGPGSLTTLGTDISKIYKIYAFANSYGRNYFGQPDDAGLYAAEVVGDKGLLAGGANGQIQLSDVGSRPTCDAAHRGSFWYEAGGVGVADTVEVCRKDASNNYAWVSVI